MKSIGNKNIVCVESGYQGVKYMREENHQSKLEGCINPYEPAHHWTQS